MNLLSWRLSSCKIMSYSPGVSVILSRADLISAFMSDALELPEAS